MAVSDVSVNALRGSGALFASVLYRDCVQTILCRSGQALQVKDLSLSLSLSLCACVCVCVCVSVRLCVCVLQPTLPIYSAACALVVHRSASNSHDDLSEYAPPCNSRTSSETSRSRKPRSSASE